MKLILFCVLALISLISTEARGVYQGGKSYPTVDFGVNAYTVYGLPDGFNYDHMVLSPTSKALHYFGRYCVNSVCPTDRNNLVGIELLPENMYVNRMANFSSFPKTMSFVPATELPAAVYDDIVYFLLKDSATARANMLSVSLNGFGSSPLADLSTSSHLINGVFSNPNSANQTTANAFLFMDPWVAGASMQLNTYRISLASRAPALLRTVTLPDFYPNAAALTGDNHQLFVIGDITKLPSWTKHAAEYTLYVFNALALADPDATPDTLNPVSLLRLNSIPAHHQIVAVFVEPTYPEVLYVLHENTTFVNWDDNMIRYRNLTVSKFAVSLKDGSATYVGSTKIAHKGISQSNVKYDAATRALFVLTNAAGAIRIDLTAVGQPSDETSFGVMTFYERNPATNSPTNLMSFGDATIDASSNTLFIGANWWGNLVRLDIAKYCSDGAPCSKEMYQDLTVVYVVVILVGLLVVALAVIGAVVYLRNRNRYEGIA